MVTRTFRNAGLVVALSAVTLAGCSSYIKRDEFDSTVADLRATDQKLQAQIDSLSQKHDALVTQLAGRVRVEVGAHFATSDSVLSEEDKPFLDDVARVIKTDRSQALITVEGFTDEAGSATYNRRLGLRRAQAVRDYLVTTGGLPDSQVRAVSYGEDQNRLVRKGMVGDEGRDNRRVSLVIDYAGTSQQSVEQSTASM